jgi:hypothetical protein
MNARAIKIAPPNSVVLLSDVSGGDIPDSMRGVVVVATPTCIAVGCVSEADEPTEFVLAPLSELERSDEPVHMSRIQTPNRRVVLRTVLGLELLGLPVDTQSTEVKVWVNDPFEPDKVVIGLA